MEGENILWAEEVKYFGVTLNRRLVWRSHIRKTVGRAKGTIDKLKCIMSRRSQMSRKNKLTLIKTFARPTFIYDSASWGQAAKSLELLGIEH